MKKTILIFAVAIAASLSVKAQIKNTDTVTVRIPAFKLQSIINQLQFYHDALLNPRKITLIDATDARTGTEAVFRDLTPLEADTSKNVTVTIIPKKKKP